MSGTLCKITVHPQAGSFAWKDDGGAAKVVAVASVEILGYSL
jgi:hypothetical protein